MLDKSEKDTIQLSKAKLHFQSIITKKSSYLDFKASVSQMSPKLQHIGRNLFQFIENYCAFRDLFGNSDFAPSEGFDQQCVDANLVILQEFGSDENVFEKPASLKIKRVVTLAVSHQLLRFYATFLAPGSPLQVPFITTKQIETISTQLLCLNGSKLINGDIFDNVARVVIDTMFARLFAQYLKALGVEYPVLKKVCSAHKEWVNTLNITTEKEIGSPLPVRKKSKGPFKWLPTRECMVTVIKDAGLYAEFSEYVKKTHCEENLVLFESFTKLEERTRAIGPLSPCLRRFLETNTDSDADKPCPLIMAPLFLFFNRMFLIPDAPFEVNVSHNSRKEIEAELTTSTPQKMFRVGIFDHVIDHVLALLYQNSYLNLVKLKESK